MNLRTLIEIIRDDVVDNYGPEYLKESGDLDKNLALKYELIESDLEASGSAEYLNDMTSFHIIKNKDTGKFYKISYSHDSWSDDTIYSISNAKIKLVSPEEVKMIQYKEIVNTQLEDL